MCSHCLRIKNPLFLTTLTFILITPPHRHKLAIFYYHCLFTAAGSWTNPFTHCLLSQSLFGAQNQTHFPPCISFFLACCSPVCCVVNSLEWPSWWRQTSHHTFACHVYIPSLLEINLHFLLSYCWLPYRPTFWLRAGRGLCAESCIVPWTVVLKIALMTAHELLILLALAILSLTV